MARSLLVVVMLAAASAGKAETRSPVSPFESDVDPTPQGRTDELVFGRWEQLGIAPAKVCSDGVFLRRAY